MDKKYVLVVDDDILFLKSIKRSFKFKNFNLLTALNGKDAIELCASYDISVVISDYKMPDMNGLSFLRKIRKMHPQILLIMITAVQDINVAIEAINEVGIFKFILKPVKFDVLERIIERSINFSEKEYGNGNYLYSNKTKNVVLDDLESQYPGITSLPPKDKDGYILIDI